MLNGAVFLRAWLKSFVLLFFVISALIIPLLIDADQENEDLAKVRHSKHISHAEQSIDYMFRERIADILVFANAPSINRYLADAELEASTAVTQMFQSACRAYRVYDQIRLIRADGQELIRINNSDGQCQQVPKQELQDKINRYYFKEALNLSADEIYVSPLDLNVEHGKIEEPYKPMIRFATPIIAPDGEVSAVIVTNFLASTLLEELFLQQDDDPAVIEHFDFLVDEQGYYLKNEKSPEREFAFMFGKTSETFIRDYPQVWEAVHAGETSIHTDDGIFLMKSVPVPISFISGAVDVGDLSGSKHWFLIHLVTQKGLDAASFLQGPYRLVWLGFYLIAIGVISKLWTDRKINLRVRQNVEREYQKLYRENDLILSSSGNGIYGVDLNGDTTFINPAAEKMLRWKSGELLGKNQHEAMHHSYHDGSPYDVEDCPVYKTLRDGKAHKVENEVFWRKDGSYFPVSYVSTPMVEQGEIKGAVVVFQDVTEQVAQKKKLDEIMKELEKVSVTDKLTELSNRRKLDETLSSEVTRASRFNSSLAVLMLDIDYFKQVNDEFGHQVGDQILQHISKILRANVRETDTLGRWGGEEFLIISPENDLSSVTDFAEKLRSLIADYEFPAIGHKTCSIGAAILLPGEREEALIARVDAALYRAKALGRNRTVVAST